MNYRHLFPAAILALTFSPVRSQSTADGFRPLFNGKDLTGWDGNPELWSVTDGCITGKTKGPEHLSYNQFLIWRGGRVKNFELHAKVKVIGNNTGIQYRSKELPAVGKWSVGGYQCDVHQVVKNNAMVYEERGRGIIVQNGESAVVDPQGARWSVAEREPAPADVAQWHDYTIIARGNHVIHKVDGRVAIDLMDFDEKARSLEGVLAFQVHRGPAMAVQVKDIMLKDLPAGDVKPFEPAVIPADAKRMEKSKPGGRPNKEAPAAQKEAAPVVTEKNPAQQEAAIAKRAVRKAAAAVGPAVGVNTATPLSRIKVAKDFKVELLYSVPGGEKGSWVNLCNDNKGRIYASDQYGGLYRFTPPPPGQTLDSSSIESVPAPVRGVNGMVFAFGALYIGVNDYENKIESGLYRVTDTDSDDKLDKVELLRAIDSKGDHGVHAVLPTPDGKALYLVCGNGAKPTESVSGSPVPPLVGEDHLLPRMPDGRGFMRSVMGPGGIIYRVTPDGKDFEVYASGFRNIFDAAVNRDGELFTYDADMEYDFNTSWYRPTRINHVVSGAEYGWRNGAGKRPEFYADNLPAVINIGPGSPTGTTFGYGAKFPAKYQNALFALDWSWGKLYAIHLTPDGASYKASKEEFVSGSPLPVTDAVIRPEDGAMYFAIGGRRVQSGLYRVTYTGTESTAAIPAVSEADSKRDLRHQLEAFHGKKDPGALSKAWPHLASTDRFIRWAARTAIEHQPVAEWSEKALTEKDPAIQIEALIALARAAGICPQHRNAASPPPSTALRGRMLAALLALDIPNLPEFQQLTALRTLQIALNRFDRPDDATIGKLAAKLDPIFPAETFEMNWLLCETLVYLQSPAVAEKAMALIAATPSQEPQIEYARSLRMLKAGWTPASRTAYLEWLLKASNYRGGASFSKFIEFIRNDALATFTDAEKQALAALIDKKPERVSAIENVGARFAGRTPKQWTLEELSAAAGTGMKDRNFENGRRMFGAAACFACHRFGNEGGMTGPDLTSSGARYTAHDLLDQILNPSKEINEQFAPIIVTRNNGETISGVVVNLGGDRVILNTDLSDPNERMSVDRKDVKSIEPSKISPMPPMLLSMLNEQDVLDLVAYVLSGGNQPPFPRPPVSPNVCFRSLPPKAIS